MTCSVDRLAARRDGGFFGQARTPTRLLSRAQPRALTRARGSALVIALILLFVLTLLATTSMGMSTAELIMAGNEMFHRRASDASAAGVEAAIARFVATPVARGAAPLWVGPVSVGRSTVDRYTTVTRYSGTESGLPQSSAEKLFGLHFEIDSVGESARNATDEQVQGVMVLSGLDGVATFRRMADGLDGATP